MARGKIPSVFVSSTCYDLGQIRADIKSFIESLGLEPTLSDYNTFPVNPNINTIDNCIQNVETKVDIFILVIGGRYGSLNDDGKSITNLEYLWAKAKGIPIYVFIYNKVYTVLPVWKDNPSSNFSSVVDSPKLFEFIDSVLNDNQWVFPFEMAQNIIDTMKAQLAFLFSESLYIRTKVYSSNLLETLCEYKGEVLRLAVEKPFAWEYRLFSEVLNEGLLSLGPLRRDVKYGIALGQYISFSKIHKLIAYLSTKIYELRQIGSSLEILLNVAFEEAVGPAGKPGDPEHIVYVAEKFIEAYRNVLLWTIDLRKIRVEDEWSNLILKTSSFNENMIYEIEKYIQDIHSGIKQALRDIGRNNSPVTLNFTLTLTTKGVEDFGKELERLAGQYQVD